VGRVKRKPIRLKITKNEDGTLTVDTPLYSIQGFSITNLDYITVPFAGLSVAFDIDCEDKELLNEIALRLDRQSTWGFYSKSEPEGIRNYIHNAMTSKSQVYTVESLKGVAHDRPLVYCGAGPSLSDNFDELRRIIKDETAIVIAGGSAIRILAKEGIKPHYCLAFDPYDFEWERVFEHIPSNWTRDIPLLTTLILETRCFNKWEGPIYVAGGCNCMQPRNVIDGLESIKEGASGVSTAIHHWAAYMGFKELTMVGVDLSYRKDSNDSLVQYADGRTEDTDEQGPLELESGIITRHLWKREALFISDTLKDTGMTCFNASKGLLIEGTKEAELSRYAAKIDPIIYKLPIQLKEYQGKIEENLLSLARDMVNILHLGVRHPDAMKLGSYQSYLKTYDYVQQFREVWTYSYNEDLLEALAYNCIEWVQQAINNKGDKND
jgi:hypothetical protein